MFHLETLLTERRKDKEVFLGWYILHIVQYICVFLLTAEEPDIAKSKKSVHVRKQVCRTWKMHEDQYSFSISANFAWSLALCLMCCTPL